MGSRAAIVNATVKNIDIVKGNISPPSSVIRRQK